MTSFFSYAVDELGILAANPALGKMPRIGRTDRAKTYAYLETETKQIRDAVRKHIAEEHRELASTLLTLGNYTSLSKSELAGLDWEDFDPVEKVLYVRRSRVEGKEGHTKTKARVRKQPLNGVSVQQLLHYKSKTLGTGPIFCGITGAFDRRPLNFKYFREAVKSRASERELAMARLAGFSQSVCYKPLSQGRERGNRAVSDGAQERLHDHSRTLHPTAGRQRESRRDPAQLDCWYGNGTGDFPCNSLKSW